MIMVAVSIDTHNCESKKTDTRYIGSDIVTMFGSI